MKYNKNAILGGLMALSVAAAPAYGAVSSSQAARLGNDLTPFGSPMAGNEAGTIPTWDGGITEPPASYEAVVTIIRTRFRTMRCCLPSMPTMQTSIPSI